MSENDDNTSSIPNIYDARDGVLESRDDVLYGLPAIVRLLSKRNSDKKGRYFTEQILVKFADEISDISEIPLEEHEITHERSYIDHANLILYVLLPKETDPKRKATLRHEYNKDYSLGIDDMKTRAAIIAYTGLSESERDKIKNEEKGDAEPDQ